MRCPKCGYISFDHLETCKKCHKSLGSTVAAVKGTAYDVAAPQFLTIGMAKEEAAPLAERQTEEQEFSPEPASEVIFAMEEVGEATATPDEEPTPPPEPERYEIEFAGFDEETEPKEEAVAEAPARAAFAAEEGTFAEAPQPALPSMDFSELDISDLAPPAGGQAASVRTKQPAAMADLEPVASLAVTPPSAPQPSAGKPPTGRLEDLNTSGLNLDVPAKPVSGSATGKRLLPSVKTGTALDKFDVDLGELFTDDEKEKMLQ
ncbi:MAG: hypothetical protein FWC49_01460 [Proteobacteria bacterium]|nr:hypothetical protein [Pseudomonadota bacterium]